MTGQWHLPKLSWSDFYASILENENIIAWVMQNPFHEHSKIIPFPYGIMHGNLVDYANALLFPETGGKEAVLVHLGTGDHHPSRKVFNQICDEKPDVCHGRMPVTEYYSSIRKAFYLFSPVGDRPDTYRHWESIGLGTMPICNCPASYHSLFGQNMIYIQIDDIKSFVKVANITLMKLWVPPDRRMISGQFWKAFLCKQIAVISKFKVAESQLFKRLFF